jgi:hypothetical protein
MRLEPDTVQLLRECFDRQTCCQCPRPAVRLARKRFYCDDHFPRHRSHADGDRRVYKHPRFSGRN